MYEYARAKVGVWWDLEDCPIPEGYDPLYVRRCIVEALMERRRAGPLSINAYGDLKQTSDVVLESLTSIGVNVLHTVSELKCEVILSDLIEWQRHNPPPATIMLITNKLDEVFYWSLCRLQQQTKDKYHLFVARNSSTISTSSSSSVLFIVQHWTWRRILGISLNNTRRQRARNKRIKRRRPKCTETGMLCCRLCDGDDFNSLCDFRNHLSSNQHALKENVINPISLSKYKHPLESCFGFQRMWGVNSSPAEPQYATAEICVFWNMKACPLPDYFDARRFRPTLEAAFENLGYSGPVSIRGFCNFIETPQHVLEGLVSTGVNVLHTVSDVIHKRIYMDLRKWQRFTPPPATMMVITDYVASSLDLLLSDLQQYTKYNAFLASTSMPSKASLLFTSAEWLWESLLSVPLTVRHLEEGSSQRTESTSTVLCYCTSCFCEIHPSSFRGFCSLDDTMKHLSTEEHEQEEHQVKVMVAKRSGCYPSPSESTPWRKRDRSVSPKAKRKRRLTLENVGTCEED